MRDDFVAIILSHGRADRVETYKTLRSAGYTGPIRIVVDDEDNSLDEYQEKYPGEVLVFSKKEISKTFDVGDSRRDFSSVIYARNAAPSLVKSLGYKYFIELDDDYSSWFYRYDRDLNYGSFRIRRTMDDLFEAMIEFLESTPTKTICMSQGGDHIGGRKKKIGLKRKAMNTFVCDVDRPYQFVGRMNDDVNTYVVEGLRGGLCFTIENAQVNQLATQSNAGGLTEMYLDSGTYVKSFYSVLYAPAAVKISTLQDPRSPHVRIHHAINWNAVAPKIVRASIRKSRHSV